MPEALDTLLNDGVIDAVLGQLKSGKEAEVWLVQHAGEVLAAKVYKERHERNFRNNAGYREGRDVRNSRTRRAMEKGSRFGQQMAEEEWKRAEADALFTLHAQGVRVPTPSMFYEGVLLMEVVVDAEGRPAPRLVEAPPQTRDEACALYLDLRGQVIRMLCADLIHGDLSAFNILCAAAGPTIIDFPQTLAAARNNQAERYFKRDLDNVQNFLAGIDPSLRQFGGDSHDIWSAYLRRELSPGYEPRSPRRDLRPDRREERAAPPQRNDPRNAAPSPSPSPGRTPHLDPLEAELRALEATVLRQGGGERAKPGPPDRGAPQLRGGQRRGGGRSGGRGPQQGQRPRQNGDNRSQPPRQGNAAAKSGSAPGQQQRAAAPQQRDQRGPKNPQQRDQRAAQSTQQRPGSNGQQRDQRAAQSTPQRPGSNGQQRDQRAAQNAQQRPGSNGQQRNQQPAQSAQQPRAPKQNDPRGRNRQRQEKQPRRLPEVSYVPRVR